MNTMHHEYRNYVFTIAYRARSPAYAVDFPDFPAIITSAATLAEAFRLACEAFDLHLESMHMLNMKIPKPKQRLIPETA
jgi:predicted RNase H-like HicB family nuclease